jgi:spore coat polysaccharide biosynthesis predicted glycosyltransferase SpsG
MKSYYKKKFLFITSFKNNKKVGTGHLYRCLLLADYIKKEYNHSVTFLINKNSFISKILKKKFFMLNSYKSLNKNIIYDYIFVDLIDKYKDYKFINKLKKISKKIIIITDTHKYEKIYYDYLILTNPNVYSKYPNAKNIVKIKKFLIVDKIIFKIRKKRKINNIKKVLITFGGYDPYNLTSRVLKILTSNNQFFPQKISINVLLGNLYKFEDQIKEIQSQSNIKINIYKNLKNIYKFYLKNDYCITAIGNTFFEISALGIPSSAIAQNYRQVNASNYYKNVIRFNYIGFHKKISDKFIKRNIINRMNNIKQLNADHKFLLKFYNNNCINIIFKKIL